MLNSVNGVSGMTNSGGFFANVTLSCWASWRVSSSAVNKHNKEIINVITYFDQDDVNESQMSFKFAVA